MSAVELDRVHYRTYFQILGLQYIVERVPQRPKYSSVRHSHCDIGDNPTVVAGAISLGNVRHILYRDPASLDSSVVIQHSKGEGPPRKVIRARSSCNTICPI